MSNSAIGDCGVCISGWDGDDLDYDTYYERIVTAKRNYTCFECRVTIAAGVPHEQCGGVYEGERKNWRFCLICSEISEAFSCDGSRLFGSLWENVEENLFPEMTTGCLAKLTTAAAKQTLIEAWQNWKFTERTA